MIAWTGEALVSAIGVAVVIWIKHREDKKERLEVAEAIRSRDLKLSTTLKEFPLHSHGEEEQAARSGDRLALTTDGLHVSKTKINGD